MKNLKHLFFLLAAICVVSLSSCKDDDDDVSPNVSLLTNGEWTGSAVFINGDDLTAEFEAEYGIDLTRYTSKFERDGKYVDKYAGTTMVEGAWEFENGERIIIFDKGTSTEYTVVISKLDEDELFYMQGAAEFRFIKKK
ncbi:hypothetical protein [Pontibacter chinhatensis]|uniref:Lipocalin-like domain-containing protein n=1 Tax=Pontibacter chinhatensis TaxID=1436961 RepID=A0A1I2MNF7_9BACT|nr:hypothetical protein [Pontibacter chinhatensis]SFF92450.1 hypothetical protein SAMN05421739_101395 [Pontibacter chinhatensis]